MAVLIAKSYKPVEQKTTQIVDRQVFESGDVLYTCLSSDGHTHYSTTIHAGRATGCTCRELPDGRISPYACYHMATAERTERERPTDLQQHMQDAPHSCIYCGRPMKIDGVCAGCR